MKTKKMYPSIKYGLTLFLLLIMGTVSQGAGSNIASPPLISSIGEFLSQDILRLILIIIGVSGIVIEVLADTRGVAGIIALIALILFFYGGHNIGNQVLLPVLLFILGFIMIIIEIFVPGFGLPGIAGIVFMVLGLMTNFNDLSKAILFLSIAFVFSFTIALIIFKKGMHTRRFEKLILEKDNRKKSYEYEIFIGKEGIALTPLRPSGTILIDDRRLDALTEGEFIKKGDPIIVERVDGFKIFVRRI
ncbi:MAG: NfeD family protein [Tissierellia bacterium]|nr:NfeD family protein [Tissierellia bacterium]